MQFLCTGNNRTRTEEYVVGSRKFLIISIIQIYVWQIFVFKMNIVYYSLQ